MRIIGGDWKGRRIQLPSKNWPVRPTTDFAREALFNILDNRVSYPEISALDLFGGTGVHSLELASRGCEDITYVDRYKDSVLFIRKLSKEWGANIHAVQKDVLTFIKTADRKCDYVFADPPYDMEGLEDFPLQLLNASILTEKGFFIMEHSSKKKMHLLPCFFARGS